MSVTRIFPSYSPLIEATPRESAIRYASSPSATIDLQPGMVFDENVYVMQCRPHVDRRIG